MDLNMLSDFMQVLNIKRKHPTNNEHFSKLNPFSTIYLLPRQRDCSTCEARSTLSQPKISILKSKSFSKRNLIFSKGFHLFLFKIVLFEIILNSK
jgi:hypothetical protein